MDFYGFALAILFGVFAVGLGWTFGDPVNKAKVYNLFLKPIKKKEKMVARISGQEFDERGYVVDRPIGDAPVVIKIGERTITRFPRPEYNKSVRGVVVAQFDNRVLFQLPLETDFLVNEAVVNEKGEYLGTRQVENKRYSSGQVNADAAQNVLMNVAQWAKSQAKGEVNKDIKTIKTLLYITVGASVIGLIVSILGAKFASDALNVASGIQPAILSGIGGYPAT